MSRRRGFTLLEMLLATALTALLVVGVMGALTNITRVNHSANSGEAPRPLPQGGDEAYIQAFADVLADDLAHASAIELGSGGRLALITHNALPAGAGRRTYEPVVVRYLVHRDLDRRWLIRQQMSLAVQDNPGADRTVVCGGIDRFELVYTGDNAALTELQRGGVDPVVDQERDRERLVVMEEDPAHPRYFRGVAFRPAGNTLVADDADKDKGGNEGKDDDGDSGARDGGAESATHDGPNVGVAFGSDWRLRVWRLGASTPAFDRALTLE